MTPRSVDVSVITPCFNSREFVGATVRSVAEQEGPTFEHVVIDDGSTDGSSEILVGLAERHAFLRPYLLAANAGASAARNTGAALAAGRYLIFVDADDLLTPGALAGLASALDATGADIALCNWDRLEGRGAKWTAAASGVPMPSEQREAALGTWITGEAWVPPCCILWRREAFLATGGWDEAISLNDDGHLAMRALARGATIALAASGRALYRAHGSDKVSLSQSYVLEDRFRSEVAVLDDIARILAEQGRIDRFAPALSFAYHRAALAGFKAGHLVLARACEARGRSIGGRRTVSPKLAGRVLERLLGLERKEAVTQRLARCGLSTAKRRELIELKRIADA